jgi:hypothetical protein
MVQGSKVGARGFGSLIASATPQGPGESIVDVKLKSKHLNVCFVDLRHQRACGTPVIREHAHISKDSR